MHSFDSESERKFELDDKFGIGQGARTRGGNVAEKPAIRVTRIGYMNARGLCGRGRWQGRRSDEITDTHGLSARPQVRQVPPEWAPT